MLKRVFSYLLMSWATLAQANIILVDPTTYPDVLPTDVPAVTIRSMLTGEPLRNESIQDRAKNTHWQIVDVKAPEFASEQDNGTLVQLKVFGTTDRCFGFQRVTSCKDLHNTVFSLIPTNTDAFAIKDVALGFCFASFDYGDYNLVPCGRSISDTDLPLSHLWTLSPPFGTTQLLKTLVR